MKRNHADVLSRWKTLFSRQGENQIFARVGPPLPPETRDRLERQAAGIPLETLPSVQRISPPWEECPASYEPREDDRVPSVYPPP